MSAPKFTPEQRRRVRELMANEGESFASAVAWVLTFESKPSDAAVDAALLALAAGAK